MPMADESAVHYLSRELEYQAMGCTRVDHLSIVALTCNLYIRPRTGPQASISECLYCKGIWLC